MKGNVGSDYLDYLDTQKRFIFRNEKPSAETILELAKVIAWSFTNAKMGGTKFTYYDWQTNMVVSL